MHADDTCDPIRTSDTASNARGCSDKERTLRRLWQQMLQVDEIGTTDSFTALGGDSLAATRMLSEVQRIWGVSITLDEFYQANSIGSLEALIQARQGSGGDPELGGVVRCVSGEI